MSEDEYSRLTGRARRYHLLETRRRFQQLLGSHRYDVVFVQKAIMTASVRGFAALLRARAKRIVYDFDDAVHLSPPHPLRSVWKNIEDRAQIGKLIAKADRVLAGNAWLASEAEALGARTELFPTVVDTDRFVPSKNAGDTYRIGWIGNASTTVCLEPVREALSNLKNASVSLIGADAERVRISGAEVVPWRLESEVDALQRFSVGIMPLLESEWMKGKCALKALQYMACGTPCVATPFGAALDLIRHDENGLLADGPEEWRAAFERLRDPALRKRIGQAGRKTVEERYSLRLAAPRMLFILESVA